MLFTFLVFVVAQTQVSIRLQKFIEKFEPRKKEVQGGAIAILHKGKVVYKSVFGKQKGNHGYVTEHTLFPLASTSKSISALVMARMASQGKLSFDERFRLPCLKHKVSLENLLSHTTGVGCRFWGNLGIENGLARDKIFGLLKKEALQYGEVLPGKRYAYTNIIFSLMEDVLKIKKTSFRSELEEFRNDLGTKELQVVPLDSGVEIAYPHMEQGGVIESLPFPPYYPKTATTAAGVFVSLEGMIQCLQLACGYRPDLIPQKILNRLYKPVFANRDIDTWKINWPCDKKQIESLYGLGWRILKAKNQPGKDLIFHGGCINGIVSFAGFIPSEDVGIVIMLNQKFKVALESGIEFWGEFFDDVPGQTVPSKL